jgi:hypothetical protein
MLPQMRVMHATRVGTEQSRETSVCLMQAIPASAYTRWNGLFSEREGDEI